MSEKKDLLVEIGTEELPPKALKSLGLSFRDGVVAGLEQRELGFGDVQYSIGEGLWVLFLRFKQIFGKDS